MFNWILGRKKPRNALILWDIENCRLPEALWEKDYPTQVATSLVNCFAASQGASHPELILSYRNVPPNAPIAGLLDQLQNVGGFVNHSFQARFDSNGRALPEHTADFRLKSALTRWMRNNSEGGLVVFITSDTDFLQEVNTVHEADGFDAALLYWQEGYTTGPGMRDKVVYHKEWMEWLREQMQMPLEMHPFCASERQSPPCQGGGRPGSGGRVANIVRPGGRVGRNQQPGAPAVLVVPRNSNAGVAQPIPVAQQTLPVNVAGPSAPETVLNRAIRQTAAVASAAGAAASSRVAARMTGFPAAVSSSSMLSIVADVMKLRLPNARYGVTTGIDNGTPVATIIFPDTATANHAVLQLNGKQHGNMQLSLQLDAAPFSTMQYPAPSAEPSTLQPQPGNNAHPVPSAPPPPGRPARSPSRAPSFGNQGGSVTACVQTCSNRAELIKLIHGHLTGHTGAPLKELEDLRIKLRHMRVLYDITAFVPSGEVVLHGGGMHSLGVAKRAFENFFRLIEAMNTQDEEVVLRPGEYTRQQLMYLERCKRDALRCMAAPFGVTIQFKFTQQQSLQMVAKGKPVRMNDFCSSFEDSFGQPVIIERTVEVACSTVSPVHLRQVVFPPALLHFVGKYLQFLGSEIQKSQDVVILVNQLPKQEQTGPDPTVVRISVLGEDMAQVDAAKAAMADKVSAWRIELRTIPAGRVQQAHTFVTGYTQQIKDCLILVCRDDRLAFSCGSEEILQNALTALDQVLEGFQPVTLSHKADEKVGWIVRKRHWTSLKAAATSDHVLLDYNGQDKTFIVAGPREGADRALARLQDTCAEVAHSSSTLELPLLPWQAPWFSDDSTKRAAEKVLRHVAAVHTVWWDVVAATQAAKDVPSGAQALLSLTVNGHLIQVFKGNITAHPVDAIVNAANSKLWHSGGVAEHICRAAGHSFQTMCNAVVAALPQGKVEVGDCVMTDAGELECAKVIHAVGPNFKSETGNAPELLRKAVTSVLQAALDQQISSLAMPLISSGIFGCPVPLAAKLMVAAVQEFLEQMQPSTQDYLKEVRFVDIGEEAVAAIVQNLQTQVPHAQIQQHPNLAAELIKDIEFEYVNGMEWGFHNAEDNQDIAYSVGDSILLERQFELFTSLAEGHKKNSPHRYYQMLADPVKYPEGMHYRIDLLKQKQKNTRSFERPIWRRPAPADKIAGAAAAKTAAEAALRAAQGADPAGAAVGAGPSNSAVAASNGAGPSNAAAAAPLHVAGPTSGAAQPVSGVTQGQQQKMLTFFGKADDCQAARQAVEQKMQAVTASHQLPAYPRLMSQAEQAKVLQACSLLQVDVSINPAAALTSISLQGTAERVRRAEQQVVEIMLRAQSVQYPPTWQLPDDQSDNLQMYDVPLTSAEVSSLVQDVEASGNKVLKVERIQNKLLYQNFDAQRRRIVNRWHSVEPNLNVQMRLWHGTGSSDPSVIYDSEEGFSMLFSSTSGMWGQGTYFSTKVELASDYSHSVAATAAGQYNPDDQRPVRQLLVADVLTGKAKIMPNSKDLKMPPEIEDAALARQLPGARPRYDSVCGMHPRGPTPIFVTYTSAATSYPAYLVTYQ